MSNKEYTIANAASDALDLALGAVGMAISLSKQNSMPVQRRLELLNLELQEIQKDIGHFERQRISGTFLGEPKMIPVDVANVLVNLTAFERNVARVVSIQQPYEPGSANDALMCRRLTEKGILEHDKSKDRFSVAPKFEGHLE